MSLLEASKSLCREERVARIDYRGARKDYRRPGEFQHERFKETRARFHTVEI